MDKNKTMRSFLPALALALCAALQPALAGSGAPARPVAPAPAPLVMHAGLTVAAATGTGSGTPGGTPVVVAGFKADAAPRPAGDPTPPQQDERRPTTMVLLLTAFLVMSGIALRRWRTGGS